jgi:ParB-like chromosome segregation protein Spo0J
VSHVEVLDRQPGSVVVAVAELETGSAFREGGLCPEHVERLVALGGAWPPIVVMRRGGVVVDGAHRVEAARRLGIARLEAVFFDGGADDAFVEFVRRNVAHGLLLTLPERKHAAVRVLQAHRGWSDRRVAELCGLSPKTVARLRGESAARPTEENAQLDREVRVGRDDRVRPVQRGSVRARVLEALREQPDASLRTIAGAVGVSPETVRLVRMNLAELSEDSPVPPESASAPAWQADAALVSAADGEAFLAWFDQTALTDADIARARTVPLSRVYELADEARRRSDLWLRLARTLEARAAKSS